MARRKGGMDWLPLDVNFFEDDKVIAAGEKPTVLYIAMCLKSKAMGSDGFLSAQQIGRLNVPGWQARLRTLVATELVVEDRENSLYAIRSWFEHNDPVAIVQDRRAADAARKRTGHPPRSAPTPNGIRTDSRPSPNVEKRREEERREDARPAGAGICPHGVRRIRSADGATSCLVCDQAEGATGQQAAS